MSDTMAEEKGEYTLVYAVASNMDRLRQSINALRQLHDRGMDGNGAFINLIAQLSSLVSFSILLWKNLRSPLNWSELPRRLSRKRQQPLVAPKISRRLRRLLRNSTTRPSRTSSILFRPLTRPSVRLIKCSSTFRSLSRVCYLTSASATRTLPPVRGTLQVPALC